MAIRSFISVPLSEEVIDQIDRTSRGLREKASGIRGITYVKPENLHITLKFLGDIEMSDVPGIADVMQQAVNGISPFEIAVSTLGGLPRIEKPRVVYVGIQDEGKHLTSIFEKLNLKLHKVKKDHKKYIPHVTLMRIKHPKAWTRMVKLFDGMWTRNFGLDEVNCIELMQSELKPDGPEYRVLERIQL